MKHLHYGWVIVIIALFALTGYAFVFYTFGVFLTPLTMEFSWDRGALSGALSVKLLVTGLLGILSGRLCDKYGPRLLITLGGLLLTTGFLLMSQVNSLWQVYLIWGIFMGIGGSCFVTPILSTIPRWFIKRRGIAVGLAVIGFGLGGVISPPLAQWLISSYGWQHAFIILGLIIFIIIIPLAQFMRHSPQRIGLRPYGEGETIEDKQSLSSAIGELSFTQAIKTGRFWFFGLIIFSFFFTADGLVAVHLVPHAIDIGFSAIVAASILSIITGLSIMGRLSIGFISDRVGGRLALSACFILMTLSLIWLLFAKEIWMFYLFAVVFGFAYGGIVPLFPVVPAELFGIKSLGIILGAIMFLGTIGGAIGAPLTGSIFDITGSYRLAFLICIAICTAAVILSLVLLRYKGRGVVVSD